MTLATKKQAIPQSRIYLSPPHLCGDELRLVQEAFESNYIAPLGPMVDAFENEFAGKVGIPFTLALSSGTAAIHLALSCLGIGPDDHVFVSTLTFIGSVTPVIFQGAIPVFIDCDRESWNMDVNLLEEELHRCAGNGKLPKAVVPTDLYGQCCNLPRIIEICDQYNVPVICDSAESLGACYRKVGVECKKSDGDIQLLNSIKFNHQSSIADHWLHAGKGAKAAIFSFNGNKIITTSGGGMLVSDDEAFIQHARSLSQQAREPFSHYEHTEIGYNYRMSNILAAIGRGQLHVIGERVEKKREIFKYYYSALNDFSGIDFMPEPEWSRSTRWLSVILIDPKQFGADREDVRLALEEENIEARPVWKPMHVQPVFKIATDKSTITIADKKRIPARMVGGRVSEYLFERGLCLPSGTAMTEQDLDRVITTIKKQHKK